MERVFHSPLYDFGFLHRASKQSVRGRAALFVARRSGTWTPALAAEVLGRARGDDVIYATGEDVGFALAARARTLHVHKPRIVMRLEQPDYGRTPLRRSLYEQYRAYALPRISRIICRTTAHAHRLSSIDRYPFDQIDFLRETTDPLFYRPDAPPTESGADAEIGAPGDLPLIVSAGLEERDYSTLIEAVRNLPVRLIIAAGSPWSHARFGLRDQGPLPPNISVDRFPPLGMRALYQAAAFVVVPVKPTLRACGMNVVLEGWSMQRAVLATRTVGLRDYLTEGVDGLFVEPCDVASMRGGIERLLGDAALAARLGQAGRQRVVEDLNVDRYVERVGDIIAGALTGQSARTPTLPPAG